MSRRSQLRLGRLGQQGDSLAATVIGSIAGGPAYVGLQAARLAQTYGSSVAPVPSTVSDLAYNAVTGNLSQAQVNAQIQQEAQALQATGLDPATAQTQATQVVNSALASVTLPGAFGITWTGALPGTPGWSAALLAPAEQTTSDLSDWLTSNWWILALGGVGLLWFLKR
jgi:hypothetical protein